MISYFDSDELERKVRDVQGEDRPFSWLQKIIHRVCNVSIGFIAHECDMPYVRVKFSNRERFAGLNNLFPDTGLGRMLEGKDYRSVDMVFPFRSEILVKQQDVLKRLQ